MRANVRLDLRLSEKERERIDRAAALAGLPLAAFVRASMLREARHPSAHHSVKTPHAQQLADAIQRLLANDWPAAHALVQDLDDPVAWRVHGLVHRIEGDLSNATYWYNKAGAQFDTTRSVEDELSELRKYLERDA